MSSPWGIEPWGIGGWGDVVGGSASATVYAISTHQVQVNVDRALLMRSTVLQGDATNPAMWSIVGDDGTVIQVLSVQVLSPSQVVLSTLNAVPLANHTATLSAPALRDSTGVLTMLSATFEGLTEEAISTPSLTSVTKTISAVDLLNRPAPTVDGGVSGTLVVVGGDYVNESGVDLVRKLIIRRLVTTPGDFTHLPTYGVGIKVKQPIPAGDLIKLQKLVEQQVGLEPDLDKVKAQISQGSNVLTVVVSATMKSTGQKVQVGLNQRIGG